MRFNINDPLGQIDEWLIKRTSRPSWTLTESQHVFLNHTFYYPGRVQYNEISVQLVDAISPNAAVNMRNMLEMSGYRTPDHAAPGEADYSTVSKSGWGAGAEGGPRGAGLGNPEIVQLNEEGDEIETWTLFNSWIKSCTLADLDYSSDELLNVDLVLRYDYFKIGPGKGIGGITIDQMIPGMSIG
jgi:hypothetical protein